MPQRGLIASVISDNANQRNFMSVMEFPFVIPKKTEKKTSNQYFQRNPKILIETSGGNRRKGFPRAGEIKLPACCMQIDGFDG